MLGVNIPLIRQDSQHDCRDFTAYDLNDLDVEGLDQVFGPAITNIVLRDGYAYAMCGSEYGSGIVYCPYCGERIGKERE